MKRFFTSSLIALFTFAAGVVTVAVPGYFALKPIVREKPMNEIRKKFDVYLERIEVRDADPSRWNINGGYLDIFDAVFFDDKTILALYLQDGMRISHDDGMTWQRMFEPSGVPTATGGFTLLDLDFYDRYHGWAGRQLANQDRGRWRELAEGEASREDR